MKNLEKKLSANIDKIVEPKPVKKPAKRKPMRGSFEAEVARRKKTRGTSIALS